MISPIGDTFDVSNHRWANNDYDNEGWRSMEHAEDRPFPRYIAIFKNDKSLSAIQLGQGPTLYFDLSMKTVCKNIDGKNIYRKSAKIQETN